MRSRSDRVVLALAIVAVAVTWLVTAADHVLGGDNAEFAMITADGGAAHPPGYPLAASSFTRRGGSPLRRAKAPARADAVIAIVALVVLARACLAWNASPASTAIACVAWALAPTTWHLATSAEVFALNALFASLVLWLAAPRAPLTPFPRAIALAVVAGLALANHYMYSS